MVLNWSQCTISKMHKELEPKIECLNFAEIYKGFGKMSIKNETSLKFENMKNTKCQKLISKGLEELLIKSYEQFKTYG